MKWTQPTDPLSSPTHHCNKKRGLGSKIKNQNQNHCQSTYERLYAGRKRDGGVARYENFQEERRIGKRWAWKPQVPKGRPWLSWKAWMWTISGPETWCISLSTPPLKNEEASEESNPDSDKLLHLKLKQRSIYRTGVGGDLAIEETGGKFLVGIPDLCAPTGRWKTEELDLWVSDFSGFWEM